MKRSLNHLICIAGIMLSISACYSPDKKFKSALNQAAVDKTVSDAELTSLNANLRNVMRKNPAGVMITPSWTIKSADDLINYLINEKGITGDAADIIEKSRKVDFSTMHIMLENSVSMQGYPGKGNPNFSDPVVALFHCDADEYMTYYVGAKSDFKPEVKFDYVDSESFLREIAHGKMRINTSSPIDRIIAESIDSLLSDDNGICTDVFCLITDGIVSGTNAEIVGNRDFTLNNLPVIEDRVRRAFEKAYKRNLHCLVYRLETPFDGVYFDYKNGRHSYRGTRPYFMIFVGDKQNLIKIENSLKAEKYEYTDRIATYDAENVISIKKGTLRRITGKDNYSFRGNVIEYKYNPMTKEPVDFILEMNLGSIPVHCFDDRYLRENLVLTYQDNATSIDVAIPNADWISDVNLDYTNKLCSMTVSINADYMAKMKAASSLKLILPLIHDEWYKDYATLDDLYIDHNDPTTFALDRLVGGMLKGFNYGKKTDQNIIEYTFTMKKD